MLVRAKVPVFVDGSRRKAGEEFDYTGPPSPHLEPVGGEAPADAGAPVDTNPLADDEIRVRLAEYGVRSHHNMKREKLLELLAEAEGRAQ